MQKENGKERMSVMIPDDQDIIVVEHMKQLNKMPKGSSEADSYQRAEIADNHWLLERENYG